MTNDLVSLCRFVSLRDKNVLKCVLVYFYLVSTTTKNVFQKHPVPGSDVLSKLMNREITSKEATNEFKNHGVIVSERTIQRHIKKMRKTNKSDFKPTSTIIPAPPQDKPQRSFKSYLSDIKDEFEAIDYSDVKKIDPVVILYKNLMKIEIIISRMEFDNDLKFLGELMEFERKLAVEIHKIAPNTEEIDYNDIFMKNDLAVEFIMILDEKHKKLAVKTSWLEFIKTKDIL